MAWKTCPHCGAKTNGYYATEKHWRDNHPLEQILAKAKQSVVNSTQYLAEAKDRLASFREYREFLAREDIPGRVRATIQHKFDAVSRTFGDVPPEADMILRIQVCTGRLAEDTAALAALRQPVAV